MTKKEKLVEKLVEMWKKDAVLSDVQEESLRKGLPRLNRLALWTLYYKTEGVF